jgi:hypothetical protein
MSSFQGGKFAPPPVVRVARLSKKIPKFRMQLFKKSCLNSFKYLVILVFVIILSLAYYSFLQKRLFLHHQKFKKSK